MKKLKSVLMFLEIGFDELVKNSFLNNILLFAVLLGSFYFFNMVNPTLLASSFTIWSTIIIVTSPFVRIWALAKVINKAISNHIE